MRKTELKAPTNTQIAIFVGLSPSFLVSDNARLLSKLTINFRDHGVNNVKLYFLAKLKSSAELTSLFSKEDFESIVFTDDYETNRIDWAIVFGGDGSVLWAHKVLQKQTHVVYFSLNAGHLGVLTSFLISETDKLIESLSLVAKGKVGESQLVVKMQYRLNGLVRDVNGNPVRSLKAINEIVANRITNYCPWFELFWNGTKFIRMSADGLIVSTSIGSTAYNSSVFGPTLMPSLPNFVVSAIAPFAVNFRSLVFGENDVLRLQVDQSGNTKECQLIVDSNDECRLQQGHYVEFSLEKDHQFLLGSFDRVQEEEWQERIRNVFKWEK